MVLASTPSKDDLLMCGAVVALVIRTIDADKYWQFVQGIATDKQVVESMFERVGITAPENEDTTRMQACILFEATVAMGWNEISNGDDPRGRNIQIDTPLLAHNRQLLETAPPDELDRPDLQYAESVIGMISEYKNDVSYPLGRPVRFVDAVRRMELVVPFGETT